MCVCSVTSPWLPIADIASHSRLHFPLGPAHSRTLFIPSPLGNHYLSPFSSFSNGKTETQTKLNCSKSFRVQARALTVFLLNFLSTKLHCFPGKDRTNTQPFLTYLPFLPKWTPFSPLKHPHEIQTALNTPAAPASTWELLPVEDSLASQESHGFPQASVL